MPELSNINFFANNKSLISRLIALLITAASIYAVLGTWIPIITKHEFENFFDIIFLFIFPIPFTLLAIYFLRSAYILWQGMTSKGIHRLSVCLSWIFAVLFFTFISTIIESVTLEDRTSWNNFGDPFLMIAAGLFYLSTKRCLLKWFSVSEEFDYETHARSTKTYFGFLAFLIWSTISSTTDLLPRDSVYKNIPENHLLEGLFMFGSIPLAYGCYRLGLKFFLKAPLNESGNISSTKEPLDAGSSPA